MSFSHDFKGGSTTNWTFTRASDQSIFDFDNKLKIIPDGEPAVEGARVVTNLVSPDGAVPSTSGGWTFTNNSGTATYTELSDQVDLHYDDSSDRINFFPTTLETDRQYRFSAELRLKSGSVGDQVRFMVFNGASFVVNKAVTMTTSWQRFDPGLVSIGTVTSPQLQFRGVSTVSLDFEIRNVLFEDVTGQTNQNPSSFVEGTGYYSVRNTNAVNGSDIITTTTQVGYKDVARIDNMAAIAPNNNVLDDVTDTFTVNGTADSFTLTVTSGNEADLFVSATGSNGTAIAMVLRNGSDYEFITVVDVSGTSVELAKPLSSSVTGGTLYSRHDSALGQHYTEQGYRAYADHAMQSTFDYGDVFLRIANDATSGSWTSYGTVSAIEYAHTANPAAATIGVWPKTETVATRLTHSGTGIGGVRQTISVAGFSGVLRCVAGLEDNTAAPAGTAARGVVRVIDDAGPTTIYEEEFYREATFHEVEISGISSITLEIEKTDSNGSFRRIFIDDIRFIETLESEFQISSGDNVLLVGDSWLDANSYTGFKEQLQDKGCTVTDSISYTYPGDGSPSTVKTALAGATSKYGVEWIDLWLNEVTPDAVVINYFTNDANDQGSNTYASISAKSPDGTDTTLLNMGSNDAERKAAWEESLVTLSRACSARGVKCVVMSPSVTGSYAQSITHGQWANDLTTRLSPEITVEGVLVEDARTNLIQYNADLSATGWSLSADISATNEDEFVGSMPLAKITHTGTTSSTSAKYTSGTYDGGAYAYSVYVKEGTTTGFSLILFDVTAASNLARSDFDWSAGEPVLDATSSGGYSIEDVGGGLYKVAVYVTSTTNGNSIRSYFYPTKNGVTPSVNDYIHYNPGNVERTQIPSSFIPTAGSTVTRSATSLTKSYTFPANNFSVNIVVRPQFDYDDDKESDIELLLLDDGTANNVFSITYDQTTDQIHLNKTVSGGTTVTASTTANDLQYNNGDQLDITAESNSDGIHLTVNALSTVTVSSGDAPTDWSTVLDTVEISPSFSTVESISVNTGTDITAVTIGTAVQVGKAVQIGTAVKSNKAVV